MGEPQPAKVSSGPGSRSASQHGPHSQLPGSGPLGAQATKPHTATSHLASFGERFAALVIDNLFVTSLFIPVAIASVLLSPINEVMGSAALLLLGLAGFALALYLNGWLPGITGQTPGKRLMGIEVVEVDTGLYIGGAKNIFLRNFLGSIVNGIPCYLGWFLPLVDSRNQTLADKIANTIVVKGNKGGFLPLFPDGNPF